MSKELDLLAKEFAKTPVKVMRAEMNLYQTNIQSATTSFLKKLELECKNERQSTFTLIAVMQRLGK